MENLDLNLINSFEENNTYENRLMDNLDNQTELHNIELSLLKDY